MSETDHRVRLRDVARGVLQTLPDLLTVNKGLLRLATLRPDGKGSIGAVLEKHARQHGHRVALVFEDRRWTYAEFNAWANRIAAVLRSRGVGPGDSVALLMENRPELLACVAATIKLGATAGMLNYNQRGDVLAHSIGLTKARVLVVGEEGVDRDWAVLTKRVVGEDGTNGGLWCSPVAKTSNPTSSAFFAIATVFLIRWFSLTVVPSVGYSPTEACAV